MARTWRERWLTVGEQDVELLERLKDKERSGAPATFELEQALHLFKLACDPPSAYNRPISQWSHRELGKLIQQLTGRELWV